MVCMCEIGYGHLPVPRDSSLALASGFSTIRQTGSCLTSELQIRRSNRYNLEIIFHISPKNIFCDPSLEPSRRDGSNEGSQHMFSLRNKKNYL